MARQGFAGAQSHRRIARRPKAHYLDFDAGLPPGAKPGQIRR
jgi:hypothetical protein